MWKINNNPLAQYYPMKKLDAIPNMADKGYLVRKY